ncbi:MAG: VOC family protein [Propionicimonas sp.]
MTIKTVAHLNFRGQARAALEYYQVAFGGRLDAISYADAHNVQDPAEADQLMWGQVTSDAGLAIMAFDVPGSRPWEPGISPFFVSVRGTDASELAGYWERLATGARIVVALGAADWSPLYGMLIDPFGVTWVLDIEATWD